MALVKCKECQKEISQKAESCPHCGYKTKRTSLFTKIVAIFLLGPILIGIVVSAINSESSSQATKSPEEIAAEQRRKLEGNRESYAVIIAEREITKRLKAPSGAKFSGRGETQVGPLRNGGPNEWVVQGYVDAQNSFGAMLRNNYQVIIEFEADKYDSSRTKKVDLYGLIFRHRCV